MALTPDGASAYCVTWPSDPWCASGIEYGADSGLGYDDAVEIKQRALKRFAREPAVTAHGTPYSWDRPGDGVVVGDCVEYVLLARDIAIEMGATAGSVRMLGLERGDMPSGHAALMIYTDDGVLAIDSESPWPWSPDRVHAAYTVPVSAVNGAWEEVAF